MRLWADKWGWCLLLDTAPPDMELMGSWGELDFWSGLSQLLGKLMDHEPVELVLSPEFFVYFSEDRTNMIPAELGAKRLGLSPESWLFRTEQEENCIHLAAIPRDIAGRLEQLNANWPEKLRILLTPLRLDLTEPVLARFGPNALMAECGPGGVARHWNWVPDGVYPPEVEEVEVGVLLGGNGPWLVFESAASASFRKLKKVSALLFRALAISCVLALLIWWRWLDRSQEYEVAAHQAQTYLDAHGEEARQINAIQIRGDIAWEKLKEIQDFSNRQAPIANTIVDLANLSERQVAWKQFLWQDGHFTIILTGPNMKLILDAIDKIRKIDNLEYLRFEELKSKARTKSLEVKIEGGFQ